MAAPVLEDANTLFLDGLIRHQVYLMRVSGSIRKRIYKLLDATEEEIAARILRRLQNAPGGLANTTELRRLETLLSGIRSVRFDAWKRASAAWKEEFTALAVAEPRIVAGIAETVLPVLVDFTIPDARVLKSIVTSRPFQGRVLSEWAKNAAQEDIRRISDAVRVGMVAGDSNQAIVRRVIGTQGLKRGDGVTQITRNGIDAITRTATNHIANQARQEMFRENSDVFSKEIFVATLDARTTPICRSLDGKLFDVGTGPIPPMHFSCRSTRAAAIDDEVVGERPARNFTERQLLREYGERENLGSITSRDDLPKGQKGKFDAFARKRKRELTGPLPAKTTYSEWLRRQTVEVQNDILGKTRARLFRSGELSLDRFVNRAGDEIPLRELAKRHQKAFRSAGLDPGRFN